MGCVLLTLCSISASAQTMEERFRVFQQQAQQNYHSFCDSANQVYADFMRQAWEWYSAAPAIPVPDDTPVPPVVYDDRQEQKQQEQQQPVEPVVIPEPQPAPAPLPIPVEPAPKPREEHYASFTYFGTPCRVHVPEHKMTLTNSNNKEAWARVWEELSNTSYQETLHDCLQLRESLALSDWGYLLLLQHFASSCYPDNHNLQILLCAWLYQQSGYTMRLAYDDNYLLHLLYATRHTVYNVSYYTIDNLYYVSLPWQTMATTQGTNGKQKLSLAICPAIMSQTLPMSLAIVRIPHLQDNAATRRRTSADTPEINIRINRGLIDFFATYPTNKLGDNSLSRWAFYANTPISPSVRETLYPALQSQLQGKSSLQAVSYLLYWVQRAFEYEYDDVVWGGDRAFFAEETLYYPYADCEDRAILFSRLVRDLVGLPVVLLYYPGHLATAVGFSDAVKGDYVVVEGKRFTICDPTYINAPVGATMPDMDNHTAKAIWLQ